MYSKKKQNHQKIHFPTQTARKTFAFNDLQFLFYPICIGFSCEKLHTFTIKPKSKNNNESSQQKLFQERERIKESFHNQKKLVVNKDTIVSIVKQLVEQGYKFDNKVLTRSINKHFFIKRNVQDIIFECHKQQVYSKKKNIYQNQENLINLIFASKTFNRLIQHSCGYNKQISTDIFTNINTEEANQRQYEKLEVEILSTNKKISYQGQQIYQKQVSDNRKTNKQIQLNNKEIQLNNKEKQLNTKQKQLNNKQKQLYNKQKLLTTEQSQIDKKQKQLNKKQKQLEKRLLDIKQKEEYLKLESDNFNDLIQRRLELHEFQSRPRRRPLMAREPQLQYPILNNQATINNQHIDFDTNNSQNLIDPSQIFMTNMNNHHPHQTQSPFINRSLSHTQSPSHTQSASIGHILPNFNNQTYLNGNNISKRLHSGQIQQKQEESSGHQCEKSKAATKNVQNSARKEQEKEEQSKYKSNGEDINI